MANPKVRLPFDGNQRLTQGFGERPEVYRARFGLPGHNGIDWGLPIGVPILAVDAGKVIVRHTSATGFGRYIKLQHSWGQSLYAHLSEFKVKVGDEVEQGKMVGLSGNSGFSTGPHLHFGMRVNPYSKGDGWYGYTNPHRFVKWLLKIEATTVEKDEDKEETPAVATAPAQVLSVDHLEEELVNTQKAFAFELQEFRQQADMWQESVTKVLMKHLPGELPPSADVLASLEILMDAWALELDQQRAAAIATHFDRNDPTDKVEFGMSFSPITSPYRRIVLKLGTSVLTAGTPLLSRPRLIELVRQCARVRASNVELIVVSSGAMAAGKEQMNFPELPPSVPAKQMLSSVGQLHLMGLYKQYFDIYGIPVGQMLLTRADLQVRRRYLNARLTLSSLLEHNILPVINENDTVTAEEIRVGDNDNLSAMVATMAEADLLILLTDQTGLFTADPRQDPTAQLITQVERIDDQLLASAGDSSTGLGTGGMVTKLKAAETATRGGATVIIASGSVPDVLPRLAAGEQLGTSISPSVSRPESRKRWLLAGYTASGRVVIDNGAHLALIKQGSSLLPIGVSTVDGHFERGDTIGVYTTKGREIARGLARYHADDVRRIQGQHSRQIQSILDYEYGDAVIHRNDLILL